MSRTGAAGAGLGLACRPQIDADLPFVVRLYASTRIEELAPLGWPEETLRAFLAQQHAAQQAHYRHAYPAAEWLIVERAGEPIGRLYLWDGPGELRVIDISLLPELRGRGLGTSLLGDVISRATSAGKPVSLHVEQHNRARGLYLRLGFEVVEDIDIYQRMVRAL